MIAYKYGQFSDKQIQETKEKMRKQIFFLLLIADPKTKQNYKDVDVCVALQNALAIFGGLNDLLSYPQEFVDVMSLLNAAYQEYIKEDFDWHKYRKLILDAGHAVLNIKEG